MGRPRKPGALSPSARAMASAAARGVTKVGLPGAVVAQLDAVCDRDEDPSRVAAVTRLVQGAHDALSVEPRWPLKTLLRGLETLKRKSDPSDPHAYAVATQCLLRLGAAAQRRD